MRNAIREMRKKPLPRLRQSPAHCLTSGAENNEKAAALFSDAGRRFSIGFGLPVLADPFRLGRGERRKGHGETGQQVTGLWRKVRMARSLRIEEKVPGSS
jgi:hypothetical protein